MSNYPSSIRQLLEIHAERQPDAPAILAPGTEPLSYARLLEQVEKTVGALAAMGLERNHPVALVLPNGPEQAVAFVAIASGMSCAPLNPAYRAEEFDFYLGDLGARALIVRRGIESAAVQAARQRGIPIVELDPCAGQPAGVFSLAGPASHPSAPPTSPQPEDTAMLLHTSGTTSRPKLVPLTQANVCISAVNIARSLLLTPEDRCLNVMPLFHIHGLLGAVLSSLAAGAGVVCTPGFDAIRFFRWLDEFKPTWYTAVPTMHQAILARAERNREIVSAARLRFVRSCSSPLLPQVMVETERVFRAPVIESYGMTEATHQMASSPLPPRERKPGSVGLAAGPEIAIMDQAGRLLPPLETGEIVIRGPSLTPGYLSNPQANAAAFTGGWFHTGDLGRLDEEGYLYITGRLKEIINRGGEKISPREVEEALLDCPGVREALVFAMPHRSLGQEVGAAIVLRDGSATSEREIRDFVARRLADFKVPRTVVFLPELPKGPTGKPQRIGLAQKLGLG
ncbi:MAG: acyl--CoA ligase [Bryobacterales bacterium]|nr:acyl--CoA ligase [Bryobacterales bacterium]